MKALGASDWVHAMFIFLGGPPFVVYLLMSVVNQAVRKFGQRCKKLDPATGKPVYVNAQTGETRAARPQPLPQGWAVETDPATGEPRYVNPATGETSSTRPASAKPAGQRATAVACPLADAPARGLTYAHCVSVTA